MKSVVWLVCLCVLLVLLPVSTLAAPIHQIKQQLSEHGDMDTLALLEAHSTATHSLASQQARATARAAAQASLAVDDAALLSMDVENHVTAAGELSNTERVLVERMIAIPKTSIPSDPPVPIEYEHPPTRDTLISPLGKRGYPWPEKLKNALTTIVNAAQTRMKEMKREKKWSAAALNLVEELNLKKQKVGKHVEQLTKEIKTLLGQKKQIQNKQLQDKLVERLEATHKNLKKVRRQNHNIKKNAAKMIHHKEQLSHALEAIKRSLALLKGMKRERQFPSRGVSEKMVEDLAKFDPDLSFEKEADEVRAMMFPDAVLAQMRETKKKA